MLMVKKCLNSCTIKMLNDAVKKTLEMPSINYEINLIILLKSLLMRIQYL